MPHPDAAYFLSSIFRVSTVSRRLRRVAYQAPTASKATRTLTFRRGWHPRRAQSLQRGESAAARESTSPRWLPRAPPVIANAVLSVPVFMPCDSVLASDSQRGACADVGVVHVLGPNPPTEVNCSLTYSLRDVVLAFRMVKDRNRPTAPTASAAPPSRQSFEVGIAVPVLTVALEDVGAESGAEVCAGLSLASVAAADVAGVGSGDEPPVTRCSLTNTFFGGPIATSTFSVPSR